MKTFAIHHLCREAFAFQQQQLTAMIVKAADVDMIFLLGATLHRKSCESIFHEPAPASQQMSGCTLLVLLRDLAGKALHEWQDKIEKRGMAIMPVTTIVLQASTFVEWLQAGHPFAVSVWRCAPVLHDAGNICRENVPDTEAAFNNKDITRQWKEGLSKAKEFLAGAELYRIRQQYKMAAFMLHQSAEQALHTILKAGTGYHANTHSIDRLLRYAALAAAQLSELFPQQTAEDKHLLQLLQSAYSDTRYRADYHISHDDLLHLTVKVRRLQEILCEMAT